MSHLPPAAEAMYFDGEPVAHIVQRDEKLRVERRQRQDREVLRARFGCKR